MNKMTGRIEDIEETLDTKADKTATEALSAEVQSIRGNIEQTKEKATQMVAKINKLKTEGEEMIKEEKERERRKNNFMVFHMPEPTDGDRNEKRQADIEQLIEIVRICQSDINENDIEKITSAGAKKDDISRPLMIAQKTDPNTKKGNCS